MYLNLLIESSTECSIFTCDNVMVLLWNLEREYLNEVCQFVLTSVNYLFIMMYAFT